MKHESTMKINAIADCIIELVNDKPIVDEASKTHAKAMLSTLIDYQNTFLGVDEKRKTSLSLYVDYLIFTLKHTLNNDIKDFLSFHNVVYVKVDDNHTSKTLIFRQEQYKKSVFYATYQDYISRSMNIKSEEELEKRDWLLNVENMTLNKIRYILNQIDEAAQRKLIELLNKISTQ